VLSRPALDLACLRFLISGPRPPNRAVLGVGCSELPGSTLSFKDIVDALGKQGLSPPIIHENTLSIKDVW